MPSWKVGRRGSVGDGEVLETELTSFRKWGERSSNLKKSVKVMKLGEPFFLLEFEDEEEAERVLNRGTCRFEDKMLHLERWSEEAGCVQGGSQAKEVWVRVVGLLLHCWSGELFKRIGDCYGVQLWWEVLPQISAVVPMKNLKWNERERVREEWDEGSCTGSSGRRGKESWRAAETDGAGAVRRMRGKEQSDGDRMEASIDGFAGYGKEAKASIRHLQVEGWFAEEKLVGGMGSTAVRGTLESCSIADACLLEEVSRELNVNPLSVCPAEERLGEKSASGSFLFKEGRVERGEKEGEDVESWRYSCLAKFCHCLGMPTEGYESEILKRLHKMREIRDRLGQEGTGVIKSVLDEVSNSVVKLYGPFVKVEREDFLSELGAIRGLWNEPWCAAGDFNMIRFPFEHSRGGRLSPTMRRFSEVIEELELRDLSLQGRGGGGMFTWSGGYNNLLKSIIDRFLISEDWEVHFQGIIQVVLARPVSDHSPIILDGRERGGGGGGMRRGPTPFRFENMWLKEEGFKEVLRNWWEGIQGVCVLSLEEEESRKEAREMYKKWVFLEEMSWRQKSWEIWLKEGDRRTKFFHQMINAHRRRNQMNRVKVNEIWYIEEREIKEEVCRVFQGLMVDPGGWKPNIDVLNLERLEEGDVEGLEKPFEEEEVFGALSDFCGEKAPGLDGFSMVFWQFSWEFVKNEKGRAEDLKDFRPVSLVGGLFEWLVKVLANRMKGVLAKVISTSQNAFVEGRGDGEDGVWGKMVQVDKVVFIYWKKRRRGLGLRTNLEKNELILVGRVENVEELADEFGYKVRKLPSTYLGMPLGAPFKCVAAWDGIEERFRKKLAMWKCQYISKGGRITLVRNKRRGGLGVKSLGAFNRALLGKWVWCFANERKTLWNQVIRGKYREERGVWRSCETREAYGVGLWKTICKMGHLVTPSFGFMVGDGKKVRFWKDKCLDSRGGKAGSWNPCFNRPFNDWELEEVERLFCCLEGKKVRVDEEDRVKWMESKDGVFSPKLSFFAWEASWGRVLTLDRLQKRGFSSFSEGNPFRMEGIFCG
ncbi:hypothetical protein CK203_006709 [Vitis vinifera]|uniref:Uncharacterized protein n=1 Tax=Vitis vinifera TaxID=29760 RepID=A0A438KAG6_VITVI|nr:hypothetical protein CK203_006709 [Vitis vinifera]